ncbi:hypothetical protein [Paraglaciecola sp. L3A3]|uniref:hypothetical protein n=1 Tax=Paraglaciecola sp. L3A3 TaxID=2686358 RepID=UPI00131AE7A8|nr:hypothetical protein [Paraglaciecola sp. L3A3]
MLTHLALNKKVMIAACICATFIGAANAKAPVILNNAQLTDHYLKAGSHFSEVRTDADDSDIVLEGEFDLTGHASAGQATQQTLTIDSHGVPYSAYLSSANDDNNIYVLKFVNNRWVPAVSDASGEVAPVIYGDAAFGVSAVTADGATPWTTNLPSIQLTTGKDGNVYLAYIDVKAAEDRTAGESENNLRVLKLVVADGISSWVAMPSVALQNIDIFNIGADYIDIEVDSKGNIFTLLTKVGDGTNAAWFTNSTTRLVKLSAGASSWFKVGGPITTLTSQRQNQYHTGASIAISPSDELYLAAQTYVGVAGNGSVPFVVQKLEADNTWTDVGDPDQLRSTMTGMGSNTARAWVASPTSDIEISASGKIYVATMTRQNYLNVITFDPFEEAVGGAVLEWKSPFDILSTRLDGLNPDYSGANVYAPKYVDLEVGSNDIPYLSFHNFNRGTSPLEVVTIRDQFVDGELVKAWVPIIFDTNETTSSSGEVDPDFLSLALGYNDRPYLLYRDESGDKHSRFLVAEVENSNNLIHLSVTEKEFEAGELKLQVSYEDIFGPAVTPDVELVWNVNGAHYDFFDPIALEDGVITLNDAVLPDGANFRYPYFLLDVYAKQADETSHTKQENGVTVPDYATVKVSFKSSPDPDVVAAREFAFVAYNCEPDGDEDENTCTVTMNENEELLFDFIQSKTRHIEIDGNLPDGLNFDVNDSDPTNVTASFSGRTTFTAAAGINSPGVYQFTVTASDTATTTADTESAVVQMTINVVNVERDITADYNLIADEGSTYSIKPDSAVAVEYYSYEMDDGNLPWLKLNALNGQLTYKPSFINVGQYSGVVYAHGYDEVEPAALPFTIEVINIPMVWDFESDLRYNVNNNTITTIISENAGFPNFIPTADSTIAVKRFYIKTVAGEALPNFLKLDTATGVIRATPGFEYESNEPYIFTSVAEGYDGEYKEVTHHVTVTHVNAPPIVEALQGPETDGLEPVLVEVLSQIYDLDTEQYGDEVYLLTAEDKYSHTGKGILTPVANGFIYAPHIPLTELEARPTDIAAEDALITLYRPDEVVNLEVLNSADSVSVDADGYAVDITGELILDDNGAFISPTIDDAGMVVDAVTGLPLSNPNIVVISPRADKLVIIDEIVADLTTPDDGEVTITFTVSDGQFDDGELVEVEGQVTLLVHAIHEENYKQTSSAGSLGNLLALFALTLLVRVYKRKA